MHGWIPITVQVVTVGALIAAIGWRNRRWRLVWLPWAAIIGVALAVAAYWYVASEGLAGDPAPHSLWIWIGLSGVAAAVLVAGWRGARWWRRAVSVVALPLCLLCSALALNLWVGYFPTVQTAWNQLTAGPLPDQTDPVTVTAMQKQQHDSRQGHGGAGRHQQRGVGFQASRRAGLPPARVVCNRSPAAAADADDDRRRVQHPRRLAAGRQRGDEPHGRFRRRARRQRARAGLRRRRRGVQQRHRMRQRRPRERCRSSHERRCAIYDLQLRRESEPRQLGRRRLVDGRDVCRST